MAEQAETGPIRVIKKIGRAATALVEKGLDKIWPPAVTEELGPRESQKSYTGCTVSLPDTLNTIYVKAAEGLNVTYSEPLRVETAVSEKLGSHPRSIYPNVRLRENDSPAGTGIYPYVEQDNTGRDTLGLAIVDIGRGIQPPVILTGERMQPYQYEKAFEIIRLNEKGASLPIRFRQGSRENFVRFNLDPQTKALSLTEVQPTSNPK